MRERPDELDSVTQSIHEASDGLRTMLAEAQRVWDERAGAHDARPGWRPFEDAFPTFYQFTNRPR